MIPLAVFYLMWATPLWLLALSVIAVVAGAVYTLRIVQVAGGSGVLASAAALAFVLNDNTARTLNYGFHTEVLYAWFIPWMIHAGMTRRWRAFMIAAVACISVKEDAFMFVFAVACVLLLTSGRTFGRTEGLYVGGPIALAILNLVVYYRFVVPRLSVTGAPFYANYWANYGPSAMTAFMRMLGDPGRVVLSTLGSGFGPNVMLPFLYLPLVGWRWFVGILPVALLYGSAANEQMRAFGIYYAIVFVPFMALAAAFAAERCLRLVVRNAGQAAAIAALLIVYAALAAGISHAGYSLRPWRPEISAVPDVLRTLRPDQVVLVQSALYPHAGYAPQVELLTQHTLDDPRYANAVFLLAPELSAYPLTHAEIARLYQLPVIRRPAPGLIAVQRTSKP